MLLVSRSELVDPFFKYLTLNCSLNVRDHVPHPYSTTGNIIVLYILIFKFLERTLDNSGLVCLIIYYYHFSYFFLQFCYTISSKPDNLNDFVCSKCGFSNFISFILGSFQQLNNSIAYGTRRFNAAFPRTLQ